MELTQLDLALMFLVSRSLDSFLKNDGDKKKLYISHQSFY